jgi:hypothetical protein
LFQCLVTVTALPAWLAVLRDRDACEWIGNGLGRGWVGLLLSSFDVGRTLVARRHCVDGACQVQQERFSPPPVRPLLARHTL